MSCRRIRILVGCCARRARVGVCQLTWHVLCCQLLNSRVPENMAGNGVGMGFLFLYEVRRP
jgi:hypothetical protein